MKKVEQLKSYSVSKLGWQIIIFWRWCLCIKGNFTTRYQVVTVFLRHGARLGATTWATAEGKPEIQWVLEISWSSVSVMSTWPVVQCLKNIFVCLGWCCWTKSWRMGIVCTERVDWMRRSNDTDVAFARYSSHGHRYCLRLPLISTICWQPGSSIFDPFKAHCYRMISGSFNDDHTTEQPGSRHGQAWATLPAQSQQVLSFSVFEPRAVFRCERRQGRAGEALKLASRALSLRFRQNGYLVLIFHFSTPLLQAGVLLSNDGEAQSRGGSGFGEAPWLGGGRRGGGRRHQVHRWHRHCVQ